MENVRDEEPRTRSVGQLSWVGQKVTDFANGYVPLTAPEWKCFQ